VSEAEELAPARGQGDRWLLMVTLLLMGAGLVMVFSASQALAYVQHRSPYFYFERQALWMVLGSVALVALSRVDYHRLRALAPLGAAICVVLMLLVLIPSIGIRVNGARRWIDLGVLGSLQPSELAKLAFILYIAHWIDKREDRIKSFADGFIPFSLLMGGALLLLFLQRDLGTSVVLAAIFGSAYLAGGGRKRHILLLGAGLAAIFVVDTYIEPYRLARLASFRDPFGDQLNTGFQSTQAILALGSGGLTGVGLGQSVEKFLWLPEAHTDFIFAIIGEETGLVGTSAILLGFVLFAVRGYRAAMLAPDRYGLTIAAAITTWISFQALLNMATVTDTLPITGVPLPLISYGGTSVAATLAAIGVLLNVAGQTTRKPGRLDAAADSGRRDRRSPVPRAGSGASLSG
jgi:cell division protein FtsW